MNSQYKNPVATLSNRKSELYITDLPAKVGRNENAVDVFFFHESISREHCMFEYINRGITLRDLGSTVGTFINGVKLEPNVPYSIEDGAKVTIGKVKFVFHADYGELATRERMQAAQSGSLAPDQYEGMRQEASYGTGSMRQTPAQRGNCITIEAKELTEYEYGEEEVMYIDCGLKPAATPLSYTHQFRKKDVDEAMEHAEQEEAAKTPATPVQEEAVKTPEPAPQEAPKVEPAQPAFAKPVEAAKPEPVTPAEEAAKPEPITKPEPAPAAVETPAEELQEEDEDTVDASRMAALQPEAAPAEPEPVRASVRLTWNDVEAGEDKELKIDKYPFYIGRKSTECDYAIKRKEFSRRHLHFEEENGTVYVVDDNSTNGVKVNDSKITAGEKTEIKTGDIISAGGIKMTVSVE